MKNCWKKKLEETCHEHFQLKQHAGPGEEEQEEGGEEGEEDEEGRRGGWGEAK